MVPAPRGPKNGFKLKNIEKIVFFEGFQDETVLEALFGPQIGGFLEVFPWSKTRKSVGGFAYFWFSCFPRWDSIFGRFSVCPGPLFETFSGIKNRAFSKKTIFAAIFEVFEMGGFSGSFWSWVLAGAGHTFGISFEGLWPFFRQLFVVLLAFGPSVCSSAWLKRSIPMLVDKSHELLYVQWGFGGEAPN